VLLTWIAIRRVDLATIGRSLSGASPGWLAAALALVAIDRALNAWRWVRLVRAVETGPPQSLGELIRIFLVSTFVGTFLPGSIGGDAVRALAATRLGLPGADAVASVVVDRLLGVVSILIMAVAGLVFAGALVERRLVLIALALTAVVTVAALLLLFDSRVLTRVVDLAGGRRFPRVQRLAAKFLDGIRQYGRHHAVLGQVLAASIAVQVLRTLQAWCLGLALGIGIGGLWYFAFVPPIVLIMQLPITINGIGTGFVAFVELFGRAGVGPAAAFALSVLFLALGWVGNLPGGLLVMSRRRM
jgi:uncharacterized protein (TIRG00374 family)